MNTHHIILFYSFIFTSTLSILGSDTHPSITEPIQPISPLLFAERTYPATVPLLLEEIAHTSINKVRSSVLSVLNEMGHNGNFERFGFGEEIRIDDDMHKKLETNKEGSFLHYPSLLSFKTSIYSASSNNLTRKIVALMPPQALYQLTVMGTPCIGKLDEYTRFEAERQANRVIKINCITHIRNKHLIKEILKHAQAKVEYPDILE